MKNVKLGIIGFGYIGRVHFRNCSLLRNAKVEAVADTSPRSRKLAKSWGVKNVYNDYKELLERTDTDAVIVSLPNFLHCEAASMAADHGKDILLEKPMARTMVEGEDILRHVKKNGVKLMMGYHYRFNDLIQNLKNIADKDTLGKIQTATAFLVGSRPSQEWCFDPTKAGGGALLDIGCHVIDLMLWFFGEASLVYSYVDFRSHLPTEDYALLLLDFKNGTKAIIHTGYFSQVVRYGVTLCGTASSASTDDFRSSLTSYALKDAAKNMIRKFVGKPIVPLGHIASAIFKEMQHFVYCIEKDVQPMITGEDGLKSLKIILKAYEFANARAR